MVASLAWWRGSVAGSCGMPAGANSVLPQQHAREKTTCTRFKLLDHTDMLCQIFIKNSFNGKISSKCAVRLGTSGTTI